MPRFPSRNPVPLLVFFMLLLASSVTHAAQPNYDPPQPSAELGTPKSTVTVFTRAERYECATNAALDHLLKQFDDKKLQDAGKVDAPKF